MRPIDADWLVEVLNNRGYRIVSFYFGGIRKIFDTKEYIDKFPTINTEELRPKGKWVERKEIFIESEGEVDAIGCTNCGKSQRKYNKTPFCPNCGADMRDEAK